MQYLTERESLRRLRAAGLNATSQTLRSWIADQRLRDVVVLGRFTYIYEGDVQALINAQRP